MSDEVLFHREGGVVELRLNRPDKRNALTVEMYEALAGGIAEAEADPDIRVILLSGEGQGFTSGNDIRDFLARPAGAGSPAQRFLEGLATGTKPLVAAVQGFAVGIGTTMLLHFDLIYAAPGTRFHLPFAALGLVPEAGSSLLLPERIGGVRAAEMLLLGEPMMAEEALACGLVTRLIPETGLLGEARRRAQMLAALPVEAIRATRALLRAPAEPPVDRMRAESRLFAERLRSEEARGAMEAFLTRGRGGA